MTLTIDGSQVREVTIDGSLVRGLTIDGDIVFQIVDSFEDNDISEYSGDTGFYSVVDETNITPSAKNGSKVLELSGASRHSDKVIISTSGLQNYPSQGDTFRVNFYYTHGDERARALFGVQNSNNFYQVAATGPNDELSLWKKDGGSFSKIADTAVTIPTDEWIEVEVAWGTSGSLDATLFDASGTQLASISGSDTTFTSGGIGFRESDTNGNPTIYNDYYRLV